MSPRLLLYLLFIIFVYSKPWYTIPLKLSSNNEHLITTMSFGSPIAFHLDIVMDTGSGKFHIYNNKNNNISSKNIIPYETESFQCICQSISENSYLRQTNDNTWVEQQHNSTNNTRTPLLPGCPIFNLSTCATWGEQCDFLPVDVYYDDTSQCMEDESTLNDSYSHICSMQTCTVQHINYGLLVNGETVTFGCGEDCFSGTDIISFADVPINKYVPYVFADSIELDSKYHNVSLFVNESWSDGTLGLIYDYTQQTSFWQILGINEQHSALLAIDIANSQLHIGNVSEVYSAEDRVDWSQSIWFDVNYHFFYIYALSVCNMNVFDTLNIGNHYLAMIDTGATCLTLPPEMFDLLFSVIPFANECNAESTFCYIPNDINTEEMLEDYRNFGMLSFKLNDEKDGNVFYISLMDLVIELAEDSDSKRYCIERGKYSIDKIAECSLKTAGCTTNGLIIFGTKVLRSLYTILDYPNKRVGFANNVMTGYTQDMYESVNERWCKKRVIECIGDDVLNKTLNICESGKDGCELYWGWTYNKRTHACVLHGWLYVIIPLVWIVVMVLLLVFVRFKMWIDKNVQYSAIKV